MKKLNASYIGFPEIPRFDDLIDALINDPPEIRWRIVRTLLRIEDNVELSNVRRALQERVEPISKTLDWQTAYRLQMAMNAIQRPVRVKGYAVVKGKGAWTIEELDSVRHDLAKLESVKSKPDIYPLVDFHIHPKIPDLKFLSDLRKAGVSHAVLLATDTDPTDVDRPEIIEKLKESYSKSDYYGAIPFENLLEMIRGNLYSVTHVTNQDVADWVNDYPDILIGFGSVNLSKSREYVEDKLEQIERLNLRGIKLLPYSQFFNPAENEHMELLFQYCHRTGSMILSHTGCAAGVFEDPGMSQDSKPERWEPMVKRFPDVPVILAHFSGYSSRYPGIWMEDAMRMGQAYPNVYADLSTAFWALQDKDTVKKIRETIGFNQVLFATDYPGPLYYGISMESIVNDVKQNDLLTEDEKIALFGGNAKRLLGIA